MSPLPSEPQVPFELQGYTDADWNNMKRLDELDHKLTAGEVEGYDEDDGREHNGVAWSDGRSDNSQ